MEINNRLLISLILLLSILSIIKSQEEERIFKCPNNYYKTPNYVPKDCPEGTISNNGGYCDCEKDDEFFNVLKWNCSKCPENSRKDLYSSSCICQTEKKQDDPTQYFNILTEKCELTETPPCGKNYFLDYSDYKCHPCSENSESEGYDVTYCTCPANSFWNDITKVCQECREGTFAEKGSDQCACTGSRDYWNSYFKNCTSCPEGSDLNGDKTGCLCNEENSVFYAKENKCRECPTGSNKTSDSERCYCTDNYSYFDNEAFKCVPCRKNSYREDAQNQIECECYKNYITIDEYGSDLCYKCPNGKDGDGNCQCKDSNLFDKKSFDCFCPKKEDKDCACNDNQIIVDGICRDCPDGLKADQEKNTCICNAPKIYDVKNNICTENIICSPCDNDEISDGTANYCNCSRKGYYWDYNKQYCVRFGKNAIKYFSSKSVFMETKVLLAIILLSLIF